MIINLATFNLKSALAFMALTASVGFIQAQASSSYDIILFEEGNCNASGNEFHYPAGTTSGNWIFSSSNSVCYGPCRHVPLNKTQSVEIFDSSMATSCYFFNASQDCGGVEENFSENYWLSFPNDYVCMDNLDWITNLYVQCNRNNNCPDI